jgi:hypothetical protein
MRLQPAPPLHAETHPPIEGNRRPQRPQRKNDELVLRALCDLLFSLQLRERNGDCSRVRRFVTTLAHFFSDGLQLVASPTSQIPPPCVTDPMNSPILEPRSLFLFVPFCVFLWLIPFFLPPSDASLGKSRMRHEGKAFSVPSVFSCYSFFPLVGRFLGPSGRLAGMNGKRFQFSLRSMLIAMACFAVACAGAAWIIPALNPPKWEREAGIAVIFDAAVIGWPMFAIGLATGIGAMCNRFWWGLVAGITLTPMYCLSIMIR